MSQCEELEEVLSKHSDVVPGQLLSSKLESNSIPVRSFLFSLENLISQLKSRFPAVTERYFTACSYKYSAPHRHQLFWRHFRQLKSLLCKYNRPEVLKTLNELHKKMSQSVAQSYYYMPTVETFRYIGATYLAQLYILQKLRAVCIKAADTMLGYIDIGHWEKLGIFILGLCAEVFQQIPLQAAAICSSYDSIAEFLLAADPRFPSMSAGIPLVPALITAETSPHADPQRVLKLLKLTDEQMDEAVTQNELNKSMSQAQRTLNNYLDTTTDMGVSIMRDEETDIPMETTLDSTEAERKKKKKLKKRKTNREDRTPIELVAGGGSPDEPIPKAGCVKHKVKRKRVGEVAMVPVDEHPSIVRRKDVGKRKKGRISGEKPVKTKKKPRLLLGLQ